MSPHPAYAEFSWYFRDMNNQFFRRKGYSHLNNLVPLYASHCRLLGSIVYKFKSNAFPLIFNPHCYIFYMCDSPSAEDEFWFDKKCCWTHHQTSVYALLKDEQISYAMDLILSLFADCFWAGLVRPSTGAKLSSTSNNPPLSISFSSISRIVYFIKDLDMTIL